MRVAEKRQVKGDTLRERGYADQLNIIGSKMKGTQETDADLMGILLQELRLAVDMLADQDQLIVRLQNELESALEQVEAERRRYQDLIDYNPALCLTTDLSGKILRANRDVAALLNMDEGLLAGKPLVLFIHEDERKEFNAQLRGRFRVSRRLRYSARLHPCNSAPLDATLTVSMVTDADGAASSLLWMIQTDGRVAK